MFTNEWLLLGSDQVRQLVSINMDNEVEEK